MIAAPSTCDLSGHIINVFMLIWCFIVSFSFSVACACLQSPFLPYFDPNVSHAELHWVYTRKFLTSPALLGCEMFWSMKMSPTLWSKGINSIMLFLTALLHGFTLFILAGDWEKGGRCSDFWRGAIQSLFIGKEAKVKDLLQISQESSWFSLHISRNLLLHPSAPRSSADAHRVKADNMICLGEIVQ